MEEDYVMEDEYIEDLDALVRKETMDEYGSVYRSNTEQTHNNNLKDVYADPTLLASPYEDEQQNVPWKMAGYMRNYNLRRELRDDGIPEGGNVGRTPARDFYENFWNDGANRRHDERRFEDMERLFRFQRPQQLSDDDIEEQDSPYIMPWRK